MFVRSYTSYRTSIYDHRDIVEVQMFGKFASEEEYEQTVRRERVYRDRQRKITC